jgi:hypothetical protein
VLEKAPLNGFRKTERMCMMAASDEKDRLGDKLATIEKVREELWAAERDQELLARLRQAARRALQARSKCQSLPACSIEFSAPWILRKGR